MQTRKHISQAKVLLVDDQEMYHRPLAKRVFTSIGIRPENIKSVYSGKEAVAERKKEFYDITRMDRKMLDDCEGYLDSGSKATKETRDYEGEGNNGRSIIYTCSTEGKGPIPGSDFELPKNCTAKQLKEALEPYFDFTPDAKDTADDKATDTAATTTATSTATVLSTSTPVTALRDSSPALKATFSESSSSVIKLNLNSSNKDKAKPNRAQRRHSDSSTSETEANDKPNNTAISSAPEANTPSFVDAQPQQQHAIQVKLRNSQSQNKSKVDLNNPTPPPSTPPRRSSDSDSAKKGTTRSEQRKPSVSDITLSIHGTPNTSRRSSVNEGQSPIAKSNDTNKNSASKSWVPLIRNSIFVVGAVISGLLLYNYFSNQVTGTDQQDPNNQKKFP